MHFWKNAPKRHPIPISEAPITAERCNDPNEFHLPTNLRDIQFRDSEPQSLPSTEDHVHAVRSFLYHVLTFRGNKVARRWPQWVLETVSYWKGDGKALRALEGDLALLCPMSAGYAKLDYQVAFERSPSGDCRAHIGLVLSTTIKKLKEKETRAAKAHEEWRATQRGYLPWNHSLPDLPGSANSHALSQFPHQATMSGTCSRARPSDTMPDLRSMYKTHPAFAPTPGHHAPSLAASEYEIPRARSMVPLQKEFSIAMAYSSSTEFQRGSRGCSSGTYTTDATSLQQSPESLVNDGGKRLLMTLPKIGSLYLDEDLLDAVSGVRSYTTPSHHPSERSTSSQMPPTKLHEARVTSSINGAATSRITIRSTRERSISVSSRGSSTYPTSEQPYPRYTSSPLRYRAGTLRTVGTLPPIPFGMNVPHPGISFPWHGRFSGASSHSPANSHVANSMSHGLISRKDPVPRYGPMAPHTPSLIDYAQNTRQTPSLAQNPRHAPTRRQNIPTVDAF